MSIFDTFFERIINGLADRIVGETGKQVAIARSYRMGNQSRQLNVKPTQFDDNIVINLIGLIANRITSQTIGGGVTFDFEGDTETPQETWVKACLDANKQEILFHKAELSATEAGTGYFDLSGGDVFDDKGNSYPSIYMIDPAWVTMVSLPENYEIVTSYIIQYKFTDTNGKERIRKKEIRNDTELGWMIIESVGDGYGARMEVVSTIGWPYDFSPIIHWQNLPSIIGAYGDPDIGADLIRLQNRVNFVSSNISKVIRLYAHPQRWSRYYVKEKLEVGPDQMPNFNADNGGIFQLEPLADLASSMEYYRSLRQSMFDCARVVDIDSMQDKLGSLTNFGLRVLYQDNLNLIATKRELFGDALEELIIRLQRINQMEPVRAVAVWPDFLTTNKVEETAAYKSDLEMGIVSQETISGLRGYDWSKEQERKANERINTTNIGAAILENFNQGA